MLALACCVLLALVLGTTWWLGLRLGFDLADRITILFCGSKKSLASGLPLAQVLFAGAAGFGMIVLPIMLYNQIQIMVGAVLCWFAAREWFTEEGEDGEAEEPGNG